jgi:hypothetical protein
MEDERKERIRNLMSEIFAKMLQALAIREFGNSGSTAIKQVLTDMVDEPEAIDEFNRLRNTVKRAMKTSDLSAEQIDLVMAEVVDNNLNGLVDRFVELCTPYSLLPLEQTQSIAAVLADMMKETEHADDRTDN